MAVAQYAKVEFRERWQSRSTKPWCVIGSTNSKRVGDSNRDDSATIEGALGRVLCSFSRGCEGLAILGREGELWRGFEHRCGSLFRSTGASEVRVVTLEREDNARYEANRSLPHRSEFLRRETQNSLFGRRTQVFRAKRDDTETRVLVEFDEKQFLSLTHLLPKRAKGRKA